MQIQRLLDVAQANEECQNPDKFTMKIIFYNDGTPGCAFGQYAAREDLQDFFKIVTIKGIDFIRDRSFIKVVNGQNWNMKRVLEYFGLNSFQMYNLFSDTGCDNATTPQQAAEYIRNFVKNNS